MNDNYASVAFLLTCNKRQLLATRKAARVLVRAGVELMTAASILTEAGEKRMRDEQRARDYNREIATLRS